MWCDDREHQENEKKTDFPLFLFWGGDFLFARFFFGMFATLDVLAITMLLQNVTKRATTVVQVETPNLIKFTLLHIALLTVTKMWNRLFVYLPHRSQKIKTYQKLFTGRILLQKERMILFQQHIFKGFCCGFLESGNEPLSRCPRSRCCRCCSGATLGTGVKLMDGLQVGRYSSHLKVGHELKPLGN